MQDYSDVGSVNHNVRPIRVDRISQDYEAFQRSHRLVRISFATLLGFIFISMFSPLFMMEETIVEVVVSIMLLSVCIAFTTIFYIILAASSTGSTQLMRIYIRILIITAVFAAASYALYVGMMIYMLARSTHDLAKTGLEIFLIFVSFALLAYLLYIFVAGYRVALKDREKFALMVDYSFSKKIFRNIIPNIFRVLGIPASNVLPASGARNVYALLVGIFALIFEAFSFHFYNKLPEMFLDTAKSLHGPPMSEEMMTVDQVGLFLFIGTPILLAISRLCSLVARKSKTYSQRLLLQNADEIRRFDNRPPILFLRSFVDDQISIQKAYKSWHMKLFQLFDSGVQINTLDELLVQRYSYIGPVIAIGNPKDQFPPIGASRKYVEGSVWQDIVISLMKQSSIIIIGVRDTESLLWEVHQIGRLGLHRKTIFLLPPDLTKDGLLMRKVTEALGASAGPELVSGNHISGSKRDGTSNDFAAINGTHIISIVYDDAETCLACITTSKQVTGMEYEMALRVAIRHLPSLRRRNGSSEDLATENEKW